HIVILSTHIISDIEATASKILVLKQGFLTFDGTPSQLVSNAHGHVWEYVQPNGEALRDISGISSMIQRKDGIRVRQISNHKPVPDAQPVDASLEDACLYALEGASL
ncbi:MAG TPA: ABC transporter ATP-binding protein, partial [Clostridiales bacterium]|nr:ABC transporter ATP-binding protein [Clostridiales bacterium]